MCSPKQAPGTYVPRLKCQSLPWKESLLVIGKTEQRAAGAGREHRGEGGQRSSQAVPSPSCIRQHFEGPLASAIGAVWPWASRLSSQSPGVYSYQEPMRTGALGGMAFRVLGSSCPGTAVSEDRGALMPVSSLAQIHNNSDLSPDMGVSIITIMGGGHQKESAVGSEDNPQRRRSRILGNG